MRKETRRELVIIPAVMGVPLYRQTMSNWLLRVEDWLESIYDRLHE